MGVNCVVESLRLLQVNLLSFWVVEGSLAVAEWAKAPVLECGQVKCFEAHLIWLSVFKIEL